MPSVAPNLPAEGDLLCEFCGYTLNGLPGGANCPECGNPTERSLSPHYRQPSPWERDRRFWATTAMVIFHPYRFFRRITTRDPAISAQRFGQIHTVMASGMFAAAALLHSQVVNCIEDRGRTILLDIGLWLFCTVATIVLMSLLTRLAGRLTTWEASYRGYRLPLPVVRRALGFHAAQYFPIGIVAVVTTAAYQLGLYYNLNYWSIHWKLYFGILSAEVILGATYLFHAYWIAMRNMMYANY